MLRVCLQPTLTYSTAFLLTVSVTSDLLVHKILLWLGYPMLKKFRRYLFLTQLTNMTNTQTDRQTDRHCMTAYASLMHRIMRLKQCTSIVQRKFTKVDCSDNCGNLIFMCPGRAWPGRFLGLTAALCISQLYRSELHSHIFAQNHDLRMAVPQTLR